MSVIVGRRLARYPGWVKTSASRVLFAMGELGNDWNKYIKNPPHIVVTYRNVPTRTATPAVGMNI